MLFNGPDFHYICIFWAVRRSVNVLNVVQWPGFSLYMYILGRTSFRKCSKCCSMARIFTIYVYFGPYVVP